MSHDCYTKLPNLPKLRLFNQLNVRSASGNNLMPLGLANCILILGETNVLTSSIETIVQGHHLCTVTSVDLPCLSIVTIPTK